MHLFSISVSDTAYKIVKIFFLIIYFYYLHLILNYKQLNEVFYYIFSLQSVSFVLHSMMQTCTFLIMVVIWVEYHQYKILYFMTPINSHSNLILQHGFNSQQQYIQHHCLHLWDINFGALTLAINDGITLSLSNIS